MALQHDRNRVDFAGYDPRHFLWSLEGKVATITLNRPERKNPLTFEILRRAARHFSRLALRGDRQGRDHHRRRR